MIHVHTVGALRAVAATLCCLGCSHVAASVETKSQDQQLAFPSAEGFGRFARGGRGGKI
jgi:hypothetical protein